MKKRTGWNVVDTVPSGKFIIIPVFDDGSEGPASMSSQEFDTEEAAQQYIDSGQADRFVAVIDDIEQGK